MPLVRGQYSEYNPMQALTGNLVNATQSNMPAATNANWYGFTPVDSTQGGTTAVANVVAVPVDWGMTFTKATVLCGAAAGTITHVNAQLYSGIATPAQLGTQSTDATSTPFTVNTLLAFSFAAVTANSTNAPNKFLYFSLGLTASVPPSFASANIGSVFNTAAPIFGTTATTPILAAKFTGGGATQPATLASPTALTAATLVWLT